MAWFDAHVLWANPEIAWVFALVARYGGVDGSMRRAHPVFCAAVFRFNITATLAFVRAFSFIIAPIR